MGTSESKVGIFSYTYISYFHSSFLCIHSPDDIVFLSQPYRLTILIAFANVIIALCQSVEQYMLNKLDSC